MPDSLAELEQVMDASISVTACGEIVVVEEHYGKRIVEVIQDNG